MRIENSNHIYKQKNEIQTILIQWAIEHPVEFPWRKGISRFHALIAEMLLQRTKAEQVVPVFHEFKKLYPTPQELAESRITTIKRVIRPLGLLWRANYLKILGMEINKSAGRIPDELVDLISLPGVGPYAASAYLSLHRGIRQAIIDSNVVRLYCRLMGYPYDGETRRKQWLIQLANELTPADKFKQYNYALLDFTREICRPKAICVECPLTRLCQYYQINKLGTKHENHE